MRYTLVLATFCALFTGCGRNSNDQGTSGSGVIYSHGGANERPAQIQQGASQTATDLRPTGGSMAGAGGAGPGYDGSAQGVGKHGTIPAPGAGFASSLTNSSAATNAPAAAAGNAQRPETSDAQPAGQGNAQPEPRHSSQSAADTNIQTRPQ